ncbi:hypothetical protein AB0L75_27990 [Streptomyces sp. NPDC052101]|uniref:hypothetical protein n=1 Tax=Streptomyces sp. NPDC052101 TaxID=3155763 RepID=UPI00343F14C5
MRRSTTTVLSLSALIALSLTGCSGTSTTSGPAPASAAGQTQKGTAPALLSSATLNRRLLDESDLGQGYTRTPQRPTQHDDVTVNGCPALAKLGADAAPGSNLDFPRKAKATFAYADSSKSVVSEELYSDGASKLSKGIGEIVNAMASCPAYQLVAGSTVIDMGTQLVPAPTPKLGDEQWSLQMTHSVGGQSRIVQQTAVRAGTLLVIVSGAPGLVNKHLGKALAKAQAR